MQCCLINYQIFCIWEVNHQHFLEATVCTLQHNVDSLSHQAQNINSKVEGNSEHSTKWYWWMYYCHQSDQWNIKCGGTKSWYTCCAKHQRNSNVESWSWGIEEAYTGETLSVYNPPLFTSLHGYRMCLRLYLDGDGQGKGMHVSLFLVIMKLDYDDLLLWPFKQKVTLFNTILTML